MRPLRRVVIEVAGPVLLVKRQATKATEPKDEDWYNENTRVIDNPGRIEVRTPVWTRAKWPGRCKDADCDTAITAGDRIYIDGGKVLCEECGKKVEETDAESD